MTPPVTYEIHMSDTSVCPEANNQAISVPDRGDREGEEAEEGTAEDSNEDAEDRLRERERTGQHGIFLEAPSISEAKWAWEDLKRIIRPP
jgi:hypothetical protein